MKKTIHLLVGLMLLVLLALLTLPASLIAQQKQAARPPKIGFCLDDFNVDRWYQDRDFFMSKVKELGGEVLLEVAYSETDAQIKQVRKLIDQDVQVLVIVPTDGAALSGVIGEAQKRGIRVIAYDRLISGAAIDYYVSYDNGLVGELMAQYMVKQRPTGSYAILSGPDSDPNAALLRAGQLRVLQPLIDKGDIRLVYDEKVGEWTEMEAMIMLDDFLDKNSDAPLDVVMAANDGLASGAILALQEHGKGHSVLVSGQDADLPACKLINAGSQTMTIYKPVRPLAYAAAELAMQLATKQKVKKEFKKIANGSKQEVAALLFSPIAVDKQNMAATVLKDHHISPADFNK